MRYDPMTERASAFVAGEADLAEAFGQVEGAALFILGVVAILVICTIVFIAGKVHQRNHREIEEMMRKGSATLGAPFLLGPNDGFVPVDAQSLSLVNGKTLLIDAYIAIFIILLIYAASLLWREKRIQKNIEDIEK